MALLSILFRLFQDSGELSILGSGSAWDGCSWTLIWILESADVTYYLLPIPRSAPFFHAVLVSVSSWDAAGSLVSIHRWWYGPSYLARVPKCPRRWAVRDIQGNRSDSSIHLYIHRLDICTWTRLPRAVYTVSIIQGY